MSDMCLRLVDLFAGIGGLSLGFRNFGNVVFASEIDKFARQTYAANNVYPGVIAGDITGIKSDDIPDCDVLLAGFPCQPFSIAGIAKKRSLGRDTGFLDKVSGTLFFDVTRVIESKRPAAFLLENVKNLISHDSGRTFKTMLDVLEYELGYEVHWKIIDAKYFVPQHRERVYIVGFRAKTSFSWDDFIYANAHVNLASVLHDLNGSEPFVISDRDRFFDYKNHKVQEKYTISPKLWHYLQDYKQKNKKMGRGFGYSLVTPTMVARTLSSRYGKDGSEILVKQTSDCPRRLTPRECARLMGYPDSFQIPVSDTQAYKQFGNSVVVPVIGEIARIMQPHILHIKHTLLVSKGAL